MSRQSRGKKQKLQRINFAHLPHPVHRTHNTTTYVYRQEDGKTGVTAGQLVVPPSGDGSYYPEGGDKFDESFQEDFLLIDHETEASTLSVVVDVLPQKRKQTLGVCLNQLMYSD